MREVRFVDTSVLCNLLPVPGKCQDREAVVTEVRAVTQRSDIQLVLPVAAVIETGNHIAQLADGSQRRDCARRFAKVLNGVVGGELPWVLHSVPWDAQLIQLICDGPGEVPNLADMASAQVGAGDVSILAECHLYAERTSNVLVTVWTYDQGLAAYAPAVP